MVDKMQPAMLVARGLGKEVRNVVTAYRCAAAATEAVHL